MDEEAPFEISGVLANTFELLRDRPLTISALALIAILPVHFFQLALNAYGVIPQFGTHWPYYMAAVLLPALLGQVTTSFSEGALAGVALAHRRGEKLLFLNALLPALRQLPVLVPVALIYFVGVMMGIALLIVPGIILSLKWSVVSAVAVAERTTISDSFRRSADLTALLRWRIFLLMLAAMVGTGVFSFLLGKLGSILFSTSVELDLSAEVGPFLFTSFVDLLTSAFNIALVCALYLALVERRGDGPLTEHLSAIFA